VNDARVSDGRVEDSQACLPYRGKMRLRPWPSSHGDAHVRAVLRHGVRRFLRPSEVDDAVEPVEAGFLHHLPRGLLHGYDEDPADLHDAFFLFFLCVCCCSAFVRGSALSFFHARSDARLRSMAMETFRVYIIYAKTTNKGAKVQKYGELFRRWI